MDREARVAGLRPGRAPVSAGLMALAAWWMLVAGATVAHAQPPVAELRRRLDAQAGARPATVPPGTLTSIGYLIDTAERIEGRFADQSAAWRTTAAAFLASAREGRDPYPAQRGKIVNRGYRSELSTLTQGYAVYIPPDYDPTRSWPLIIVMHGGSSNGNLFLGVVLGNNMSWLRYNQFLWNEFEPRWSPHVVVVAPDGFGQVMWRWMGEQDVLDVISDVQRHYNIDPDRVVLTGLSNGGVGAYSIGARHAWRFSVVQAISGAPSWLQYAGGHPLPAEQTAMRMFSALHLVENTTNTDFRFYHGLLDTGPMKPRYVTELEHRMETLGLERHVTWYDAGHDILYRVHHHGRSFDALGAVRRNRRPTEVRVVTGDYRANRQHWITVTRIAHYPVLSHTVARVEGQTLRVETDGVRALSIDMRDVPLGDAAEVTLVADGAQVYRGPRTHLGHVIHLVREGEAWRLGFPDEPPGSQVKRPGVSGPLTDAYYGRMVHVFGTQDPEHTDALRRAARRGARGWPLWLWRYSQEVVPDTAVDEALMRSAHLVLYATAGDNAVLERLRDRLPIRIEEDAVSVGGRRYEGSDVGVRFIFPNPLAPDRYVVVQGGVTTDAVAAGRNLPDFLPDYLVYDHVTTRNRQRLATGRNRPLAIGYFDDRWALPSPVAAQGGQPGPPDAGEVPLMPVPPAPPLPPRPRRFAVRSDDPAGRAARRIAALVPTFHNYRAEIAGATWRTTPRARWSVRPQARCYSELEEAGVPFRPTGEHPTPVPSPVEILGPVDGVWLRIMHDDRPLTLSCEMALRLPALVAILERHGVLGVDILSAYRDSPRPSFHTMGMGLDLARFWTARGWLSVLTDFRRTPAHETCRAPRPRNRRARTLLQIACEIYRSRLFASVLTPNYNAGHRNHFHLDARPDDPRLFLR